MSGQCGSAIPEELVRSLISVMDCQSSLLGTDGWRGLAGSGTFSAVLTGFLTLAVVRLGYRLMAGAATPPEIVRLVLQIGFVIALSTNWQSYNRLVYRAATQGPSEIAASLFPAAGIEASGITQRLQNAYDAIRTPPRADANGDRVVAAYGPAVGQVPPQFETPPLEASSARLAAADLLVVIGAGSWIAARLVLAVMLAIGPFAIVASLLRSTSGLFTGWLRTLMGAALATLVVPLSLSLELQVLEEPVREALQKDTVEIAGLNVIVWSFTIVTLALVAASQRLAGGLIEVGRIWLAPARPWDRFVTAEVNSKGDGAPLSMRQLAQPAAPGLIATQMRTTGIIQALQARAGAPRATSSGQGHRTTIMRAATVDDSGRRRTPAQTDRARRTELGLERGVAKARGNKA
jgi:type IV secretion system protein VirB6